MAGDLETGNQAADERAFRNSIAPNEKTEELDEYSNLVRYISTYRDQHVKVDEEEDEAEDKKPWYAFWRKAKIHAGITDIPPEWLETDINRGLTSDEVEQRRKKCGFNELADVEKNLLKEFIGYFRGPVLYGTQSFTLPFRRHQNKSKKKHHVLTMISCSYGACCPACCRSSCMD
jgi:H+-transporting ATPase